RFKNSGEISISRIPRLTTSTGKGIAVGDGVGDGRAVAVTVAEGTGCVGVSVAGGTASIPGPQPRETTMVARGATTTKIIQINLDTNLASCFPLPRSFMVTFVGLSWDYIPAEESALGRSPAKEMAVQRE
ncbi:MAG: hypothetical protein ABIJ39_05890, partial [Chloroflexota bacterium]